MVPEAFITVYHSIGGWKAVCMVVHPDGFPEPEFTGFGGYATREEAIAEAEMMAEGEGLPLRV